MKKKKKDKIIPNFLKKLTIKDWLFLIFITLLVMTFSLGWLAGKISAYHQSQLMMLQRLDELNQKLNDMMPGMQKMSQRISHVPWFKPIEALGLTLHIYNICTQYELDPLFVEALFWAESSMHPYVRSPKGALGIGQVKPYHFYKGENPHCIRTNTERAMWILALDMRQSKGNRRLAVYRYNSGKPFENPESVGLYNRVEKIYARNSLL